MTGADRVEARACRGRQAAQRRSLVVLGVALVLSGAGPAAGVTVGALLAQDVLGSTGLAGTPRAVGTAGTAPAAFAVGRLSQARGRRPGLAAGYLAGAVGSAGVAAAAVLGDAVLLSSPCSRRADRRPRHRPRPTPPDRAVPARRRRLRGGRPRPDGLAAPDPLLPARTFDQPDDRPREAVGRHRPGARVGVLVMVLTQLVMVAIMTMTPVHMHGHGAAASGSSSPSTSARCTCRHRCPAGSAVSFAVALALLGVGWNLGLVAGTAIITDAAPPATRARSQGLVDVAVAVLGAAGGGVLVLAVVPAVVGARDRSARR